MPAILGLRGTGEFDQHFRPQNYREAFTMLEPNGTAPLNALLAMTGSESTDDPQYHNFRDEMPERRLAASAAAAAGVTAVSVTITDTLAFCVKGALLVNTVTGEVMQLTADANPAVGTVNVTRNISGTNFAIANGDEIIVAGYAAAEGDRSPSPISFDPTRVFNYTQIFRTSFAVTETLKHTRLRLGDKEQENAAKALKMHMSDIERAMFFGKKHIVNPSTATQEKLDPTVTRVEKVAQQSGFDGFVMLNLYPVRATDPKDLPPKADPVAYERNLEAIEKTVAQYPMPTIWAAWGELVMNRPYLYRTRDELFQRLAKYNPQWRRFGELTANGHPRHPRGLSYSWTLEPYEPA